MTNEAHQHPLPGAVDPTAQANNDNPFRDMSARVLWTGNAQARHLAEIISGESARQAFADLATACIGSRATLLVARGLLSFDLCNLAVPHGFSSSTTRSVVAAVGGGPHSLLAATLAYRLSQQLRIPARAVYGHSPPDLGTEAADVLADVSAHLPNLAVEVIETPSPATMVEEMPAGTLLVVGAPGGSWFHRQFFGPGARMKANAPSGTIIVRSTAARVYQVMKPAIAFGPDMRVSDALRLSQGRQVVVALDGQLLGVASIGALRAGPPDRELRVVMEEPVFLAADEHIEHATELINQYQGNPVPVVDSRGRLVGTVAATDLTRRRET